MKLIEGSRDEQRTELERAALRAILAGSPERHTLMRQIRRAANDGVRLDTVEPPREPAALPRSDGCSGLPRP